MITAVGYSFGDSDVAAHRLDRLAEVYAPATAELLRRSAPLRPRVAVDIGCGPGHTTRLLHEVCAAPATIGIDSSPRLLALARTYAVAGVKYVQADVSGGLPGAVGEAQLLYCRFLLTHLENPVASLAAWRRGVGPGALLIVEELEWLRSGHPVLWRYYDLVEAVQAARGQQMYIGAELTDMVEAAGWEVLHSHDTRLEPSTTSMAMLHSLNLMTLRHDPALASTPSHELDHLARGLEAIARGDEAATLDNGLRQVVARERP